MPYLIFHDASDELFQVETEDERNSAVKSGECEDVTGIAFYEEQYSRKMANIAAAPDIPPAKEPEMITVQLGEDDAIAIPKDANAIEAIKQKAVTTAMSIGMRMGIHPLHIMSTPKNRVVGFPFPVPRPGQLEAVDACIDVLLSGSHCLLEAATGTGKSPIAVAVASYFKTSWLLVGRNDLIDQWENDFHNFAEMGFYKARGRFTCVNALKQPGKTITCADKKECEEGKRIIKQNLEAWEEANERYFEDPKNNPSPGPQPTGLQPCPYAVNRDVSLSKSHTASTLALGLTVFKYLRTHPMVTPRELLVVDECSELESELIRFHTCTISTKTLTRGLGSATWASLNMDLPPAVEGDGFIKVARPTPDKDTTILAYLSGFRPSTLTEAHLWALIAQDAMERVVAALSKKTFQASPHMIGADGKISQEDQKLLAKDEAEHKENIERCQNIVRQVKTAHEAMVGSLPYCHEILDGDNGNWQLVLKPLEARGLFDRLLAKFGMRFLFVSATTGTAEGFRAAHGMTTPLVRIEVPSPFPVQNRPVVVQPVANMSAKTYDRDLPAMLDGIYNLVQQSNPNRYLDHQSQRGVIHTYTTKLTNSVYESLKKRGLGHRLFILKGSGRERENAMLAFRSCPNGILISPSAMLGLSLNDDMARWQIIAKVPYSFLGDASVVHRKDNIDQWYEWQTAKDIIQTLGRVVRSKDDWGYTYILDEAFVWFYRKNSHLFPSYVKEAFYGV